MKDKKYFDAIVVGAGPAGSAAAFVLAKSGLKVVVLERGEYPGAKNVSGAALYNTHILEKLYPDFRLNAPIERHVTRKILGFMSTEALFSIDFKSDSFSSPPFNCITVIRPKFDYWLAEKAKEAGALIVNKTVVRSLIKENEKFVGVRTRHDNGEIYADVIIAADGVNSFLAKEAGLQREFKANEISLGIKEIISLSPEIIEERFNLNGNEGTAFEVVGSVTRDVNGGGFLYTNKKSISIGVVGQISSLIENRVKPYELLEDFKKHPAIWPLIRGGRVKEYSAHMIPEGGWEMLPKLYAPGLLVTGDAAGFVLVTGYLLLGINFAIMSGITAAETVIQATQEKDFSSSSLSRYEKLLYERGVLSTFKKFKRAPAIINNFRVQNVYPQMLCSFMENLYQVQEDSIAKILGLLKKEVKKTGVSLPQVACDIVNGGRTFAW